MKKNLTVWLLLLSLCSAAQNDPTTMAQPIVVEGKRLYRSEMASWYGTDLFLAAFKDQARVGGYFSYLDNQTARCIFYSKDSIPKVIGTISFDSSYNTNTAQTDLAERNFSPLETDYYQVRAAAMKIVNSDTLFKSYQNCTLNLIPLVSATERKVYAITGTSASGLVIFGNDYLLSFDQNNTLLQKKALHRNIIPINFGGKEEEGKEVESAMHSHAPETGEFITATDICTLMLYEKFTKWKQHNVVSKNYLNIWDCKKDALAVIPMEIIRKINKDVEKREKKKKKTETP
jgi:hypothetical protein